jgi:hypothetical protein
MLFVFSVDGHDEADHSSGRFWEFGDVVPNTERDPKDNGQEDHLCKGEILDFDS